MHGGREATLIEGAKVLDDRDVTRWENKKAQKPAQSIRAGYKSTGLKHLLWNNCCGIMDFVEHSVHILFVQ